MSGPGKMRDRVHFQQMSPDANGDRLGPWVTVFTVAAEIDYQRGSEAAQSQRLQGEQPAIITVRSGGQAAQIGSAWRAVDARNAALAFEIRAIAPAKRPGYLSIVAVAERAG